MDGTISAASRRPPSDSLRMSTHRAAIQLIPQHGHRLPELSHREPAVLGPRAKLWQELQLAGKLSFPTTRLGLQIRPTTHVL